MCIAVVVAAKKPNFIFVLTDDQDLRLGSLQAMPFLSNEILPQAANLSNFFVHTPVTCADRHGCVALIRGTAWSILCRCAARAAPPW